MLSEVSQLCLVSLWNIECKTTDVKKDSLKLYSVMFDKWEKNVLPSVWSALLLVCSVCI